MIEDPMDPALASLIDEERAVAAAEDPPLGAMRARLLMSVGVAGAATLSASTAAAAASDVAKVTAITLKTKLIGAVVVAAVSAGSGAAVQKHFDDRRYEALQRTIVATVPPPPAVVAPTPPPPAPVPAPEAKAATASADASLQAERRLIETARTALLRKTPENALQALALHRRRFATGRLQEERDSLEVQALMAAGRRQDAQHAAESFLQHHPESIFSAIVRASVRETKKEDLR